MREVPVAAPTGEAKTLLELARLDLARRPPGGRRWSACVCIALPARVRATQLDILRPAGPAPDRLAATLARLAALVGPDNVGAPAVDDSWREEAVAVTTYEAARPTRPAERGPSPLPSPARCAGRGQTVCVDPSAADEAHASRG